jgi:hypothetical protein
VTETPPRTADRIPAPADLRDTAELACALTLLRDLAGLSVRDVAKAMGEPSGTLGGYFAGRHLPPVRTFTALLAACGVRAPDEVAAWHDALRRIRRTPGGRPRTPVPYMSCVPMTASSLSRAAPSVLGGASNHS